MDTLDYGSCHHCGISLLARYWCLDRNIEQVSYSDTHGEMLATIAVIESVGLMLACGAECADSMVASAMAERGYKCLHPGDGPVEPCAKCGKPVILTNPHVAYALTSGNEMRAPWATTFDVDHGETVAILCPGCEQPAVDATSTIDVATGTDLTKAYCVPDASVLVDS